MQPYIVFNQERNKTEIHTGGKAEYLQLPSELRDQIKQYCTFSRGGDCWIAKGTGKTRLDWITEKLVAEHGYEDRGETGERLSFAEQAEQKQDRAEARAERYERYAAKATEKSDRLSAESHAMIAAIPFGQPILTDHYSARRDRNYRDRAWNKLGTAVKLSEKADYLEGRAQAAERTAEATQYQDRGYLDRRLQECEKELRDIERRRAKYGATHPVYVESKLEPWKAEAEEKRAFFQAKLDELGGMIFNRENVKSAKEVQIRGIWLGLVRANEKTVSVCNPCFPSEELQRKYPLKYRYREIQDVR